MSFGTAVALVQKFAAKSGASTAFPNLGVTRAVFAHELMNRLNSSSFLDQGTSSLCGPTVFLFWIMRKDPEIFARYVTDLYDTGQAKIGSLTVKPGQSCRNHSPQGADISAVDWVALASLRDSSNSVFAYDSPAVQAGGITLPGGLASWFKGGGFPQVDNHTNLLFDAGLGTLLKADQLFGNGASVCLFIGANLLTGGVGGRAVPDHWVGLTSPVRIGGAPAVSLLGKSGKVLNSAATLALSVTFDVFTWGETNRPVHKRRPQLDVRTFLDYFYGFVAAR